MLVMGGIGCASGMVEEDLSRLGAALDELK
jgi:hypothetical protein